MTDTHQFHTPCLMSCSFNRTSHHTVGHHHMYDTGYELHHVTQCNGCQSSFTHTVNDLIEHNAQRR